MAIIKHPENEPIPEGCMLDNLGRLIPIHAYIRESCVAMVEEQTRQMIEDDQMRDAFG